MDIAKIKQTIAYAGIFVCTVLLIWLDLSFISLGVD